MIENQNIEFKEVWKDKRYFGNTYRSKARSRE